MTKVTIYKLKNNRIAIADKDQIVLAVDDNVKTAIEKAKANLLEDILYITINQLQIAQKYQTIEI